MTNQSAIRDDAPRELVRVSRSRVGAFKLSLKKNAAACSCLSATNRS